MFVNPDKIGTTFVKIFAIQFILIGVVMFFLNYFEWG